MDGASPRATPPSEAGRRTVLVGSPGDWQTEWRALGALRARPPVIVDGCGPGDVRTLLGVAGALPPITHPDDAVLVPAEGEPTRVSLPS